jgi:hypothetical protein
VNGAAAAHHRTNRARRKNFLAVTFSTSAQAAEQRWEQQRTEAVIMKISAVSTNTAFRQREQADQHRGGTRRAYDAAADALGMTRTDLRGALSNGQTISSIAQAKGIGTERLTNTISTALTNADTSLSATAAQQLAQRVVAAPPVAAGGPNNDTGGGGSDTAGQSGGRTAGRPFQRLDQTDRISGRQLDGLARLGLDVTGTRDTDTNATYATTKPSQQAANTAQARYADAQSMFGTAYGQQQGRYAEPFAAFG